MSSHDFAPRRIGELLDDAIVLVSSNWRTVLAVSAAIVLPVAAAYSVVASFYVRSIFELTNLGPEFATGAAAFGPAEITMLVTIALMQMLGLMFTLARALFDSTLYAESPALLERRRVGLGEALKAGLKVIVPVVAVGIISAMAAGVVAGVIGFVGVMLALVFVTVAPEAAIAGVVLAYLIAILAYLAVFILLSLAQPIVAIEGGIGKAFGRSFGLVRRHFWRVLLVSIAVGLVGTQFESALAAPTIIREVITGFQSQGALFGEIGWGWKVFDGVAQGIAIAVVLPFTTSAMLLNYLDLRARDEGMDLIVRARGLMTD